MKTVNRRGEKKVIHLPRKRTKRGRNSQKTVEIIADLRCTTLQALGGQTQTGCLDVALLIQRVQIHDRKAVGAKSWHDYPSDRKAYVGVSKDGKGLRFIRIDHKAKANTLPTRKGETVVALSLPWEGCGRDLAEKCRIYHVHSVLAEAHAKRNKKRKRA